jgi:hypothetical protein
MQPLYPNKFVYIDAKANDSDMWKLNIVIVIVIVLKLPLPAYHTDQENNSMGIF